MVICDFFLKVINRDWDVVNRKISFYNIEKNIIFV